MATAHDAFGPDAQTALVKQYCAPCHSDCGKAGGLSLASFDAANAADEAVVAEKMLRKLHAGMMPPPGARRPEEATVARLVEALETRIDQAAALNPNPGSRPFQRLNRAEYARAVKDLLAIDVDVNAFLPPDTISHGFDNVADVQTFSPTLMEGYLEERILDFAKINKYHVSLLPYFLEKLKMTPDGDGSLLDHALILYGSPMGNPNVHNHKRCPLVLAGHAGGQLKGHLHLKAADGTPMANVMLAALQKLGVETESFGDSAGAFDLNAVPATATEKGEPW